MIKAKNLVKKFGELTAVNDLSFEVREGEIFGIAGPNGAGKSTVYNLITGFYPFQGQILFNNRPIAGKKPHQIARLGIARTFQIPQIFQSLSVEKCIDIGSRFGNPGRYNPGYREKIIEFVNLGPVRQDGTAALKLLDKKRLMIGAALATQPKILMLDEPMAGSNATEIRELMDLIVKINQDLKITVIIIEHFMKVLTELTHTLLILESGRKICIGQPQAVTGNPDVIECYLGDSYA